MNSRTVRYTFVLLSILATTHAGQLMGQIEFEPSYQIPIHDPYQPVVQDPYQPVVQFQYQPEVQYQVLAPIKSPPEIQTEQTLGRVRQSLDAVTSQIASSPARREKWESLLALEPLQKELGQGEVPTDAVLRKTIDGLRQTEKPMDKVRSQALRAALADWIEDSQAKDSRANPDPKEPPSEEGDDPPAGMSADGAAEVAEAAAELSDWLKRTGGRAWTKIIPLPSIEDIADAPESADPEEVKQLLDELDAEMASLDRTHFLTLRRNLQELLNDIEYPIRESCAVVARQAVSRFCLIDPVRAHNARHQLVQSLARLNGFLATGSQSKQDGWTEFLKLDALNESVHQPGVPLVSSLLRSFTAFNSGEPGLELHVFSRVRTDLEVYLEILQYTETSPERLAQGQQQLRDAVATLDRFLQSTTQEKRQAWKKYLEWETLDAQLDEMIPDVSALRSVGEKFQADEEGLDLPQFKHVGLAIEKLHELTRLHLGDQAEDIYRARMEQLARTLELHELDPSNETDGALDEHLAWMQATSFAPEVAMCIRGRFSRRNFFASVSGAFVTRQINDTITDAQPVRREFEGSQVSGCARTNAWVTAQLIPNRNGVTMDVLLNGQTVTQATAQKRKVYVRTQGNTDIVATKRLFATLEGMYAAPAVAHAATLQRTCGVCIDRCLKVGNRLITRIARRKAEQSRLRAQNLQSQEAREKIAERMDQQADEMIQQANQRLQQLQARIQDALQGREHLRPQNVSLRSTTEKILADGTMTAGRFLGAPSNPPNVGEKSDLTLQIHQSAINNALKSILSGIKLDNERMVSIMEQNGMPIPDELKPKPVVQEPTLASTEDDQSDEDADEDAEEDEAWSITFDTRQPATVQFVEGKVRIAIRGRKFTQGEQEVKEPIEVGATYRLRRDLQGRLEARMVGEVEIAFVNSPGRLNTRQLAYKTFIKRKTGPLFRRTFSINDLPEGQLKDQARQLLVDEVEATRGWLAIALSLEQLAQSMQLTMRP